MRYADKDSSGTVDAQELAAVFERHELPVTQDEVQALIRALDTDGNGNVDKHEFLEQMRVEQNRRRVLAKDLNKDLSKELKPAPPSRHRPASMDTVKSRRVRAMERVQEAEREREAVRAMEHRLHAEMLREAAHAKAAEEALRMKAAASAIKVKERQLQKVRLSGLFASYGSRLASTVLPPISHKTPRAGGTPRGTTRASKLATPMTA